MANSKLFSCLIFLLFVFNTANSQGLKVGFYDKACPRVEAIVQKVINDTMSKAPSLAGPLLRMHFHDCLVRGCEGSVLLNSSTHKAEKDAVPNLSLRGFQIIDNVKTALEKECPGIVSCADILALVARDVTVADKGQSWQVETGRRDGRVSNITEALLDLIPPTSNITQLKSGFQRLGLSVKDLVVLSGAHTIGTSHCSSFTDRLYNFTGVGDTDPTLDPEYIARLKLKCKPDDTTTLAEMDPGSFRTFDVHYYTNVAKRRGLFQSDGALLDDGETKAYVGLQATNHGSTFLEDFGVSMVNMGRIGVLTGTTGEIRKVCSKVNES
ncbi:peroxidase domain-containing protein [Cephalotus follicularis]|uniref:Peroxidase n=1 Tax=Cephalotus follicularis TaxID=3775 RepID=A0A1Q3DAE2_CEPFO|nr:peroxidase domain-containing protein [Cephalotus follicularis]